jgi:ribosomal protein S18 acetylase RimI-like enzyme
MPSANVRLAHLDDLPRLLAVDHLALRPGTGRQAFISRAVAENSCWVASLDETVVGYGVLGYTFYGNGFISMVYVEMGHRRRGVATALLQGLERACQTPKLFTSTNMSNLPMQALLARQGYALSGVIHNLNEADLELVYFKRVRKGTGQLGMGEAADRS